MAPINPGQVGVDGPDTAATVTTLPHSYALILPSASIIDTNIRRGARLAVCSSLTDIAPTPSARGPAPLYCRVVRVKSPSGFACPEGLRLASGSSIPSGSSLTSGPRIARNGPVSFGRSGLTPRSAPFGRWGLAEFVLHPFHVQIPVRVPGRVLHAQYVVSRY
jgi:hypothetical protein